MSNLLPAKIERVWLVDSKGSAVEKAKAPKKLSSGQRHYMYRLGLMAVDQFLKDRGFRANSDAFSYEKNGVWIDMKIAQPGNIAYVTSHAGYEYSTEKVKATVITAKEIMGSDMLIQLVISTNDSAGTRSPIFVPLPKDLEKPAQHVLKQVLGTLALACDAIPKVKDAFAKDVVEQAQEQAIDISDALLLE